MQQEPPGETGATTEFTYKLPALRLSIIMIILILIILSIIIIVPLPYCPSDALDACVCI